MLKCKIAMKQNLPCQKCCFFCDEKESCDSCCGEMEDVCVEQTGETTELEVMKSTVPEVLQVITDITVQKKNLEEQEKLMKSKLLEAMEKNGIKSFENDKVKFLYIAPTTRTSIDSAKLKKELPDVAEKYSETSNVSASVRITVK